MVKDDFDISKTYDLSNHTKVPIKNSNTFHEIFSVLSVLLTPFKLKIYNCSHRHHCESKVYISSMMGIIIPVNYLIVFHSALVQCGTASWYFECGVYYTNTR